LGCADSTIKTITVRPLPEVDFGTSIECPGDTVFFADSSTIASGSMVAWSWSFGDDSTGTGKTVPHLYDSSGSYQVDLSVASGFGCIDSSSKEVSVGSSEFADLYSSAECPHKKVFFKDSSAVGMDQVDQWDWDFGDGDSSDLEDPVHEYEGPGSYTVSLAVGTKNGCKDTVTEQISVSPDPTADFSYEAQGEEPRVGEPVSFSDSSSNASAWQWSFGDNSLSSTEQNPEHVYSEEGSYVVTQIVEDGAGCRDTALREIGVAPGDEVHPPAVPTGFSPNGDGTNDILRVRGGPFEFLTFKVYNQWGTLVFSSNEQDKGWDGIYQGERQPVGDYVYTIKATTIDGERYSFSGDVTLIR
jgi:gliding motility-associated-like protein